MIDLLANKKNASTRTDIFITVALIIAIQMKK